MNWFELINKATDYIENHISEDLNSKSITKHCNVSYHYFIKTFSMITGYSLMEYVRNRRITLASYELSNTESRIIDVALKYGYSSNETFTRAFKRIHGINPSDIKRNEVVVLTHFPVLKYDIPKPNVISLRYDIITDIEYNFIGKSTYIVEKNYEDTQSFQLDFLKTFKADYSSNKTVYRIHHNLSFDNLRYDYMVGYLNNEYDNKDLSNLKITSPKAIRFISNNISPNLIPETKRIIYDEWQKNKFLANGRCEIEYTIKHGKDTVDFYYIVSIK